MHYIYIKKVDNSIVKVGSTEKYNNRYKQQSDQLKSDFDNKKLLHLFECNDGEEKEIESMFKKNIQTISMRQGGKRKRTLFLDKLNRTKIFALVKAKNN